MTEYGDFDYQEGKEVMNELDFINFSEWLDASGYMAEPKDALTHEDIVRKYIEECSK